ncbi:MAG: SIMPL domain-containing protein [Phycisphaerae bacterium]|jgi:hypothetical protein
MECHVRLHAITVAIVITLGVAVSLVTSTVVAARAYRANGREAVRRDQTIVVKGSTRQRIVSDRAVWQIEVGGRGAELREAFGNLATATERVRRFLGDMGFRDAEIGLAAIRTTEHYARDAKGNRTREVAEYSLGRQFTVTTADVQAVNQSAGRVTELLQEGLHVISYAPRYYYTQLAQLKIDLMAAASADARARAEQIATSAGCRLGELRDARMGVLQVTEPLSTDVSDYGLYDTDTIDKDVQAVVTATFGIAVE